MTSPLHSIRWRLQLWHGLILLLALSGVCVAVYRLAWITQLRRIDREIGERERTLFFTLARRGGAKGAPGKNEGPRSPVEIIELFKAMRGALPADVAASFQGTEPGYLYFSFRDREGNVLIQSSNAPADLALLPVPERGLVEEFRSTGRRRELCRSVDQGLRAMIGRDLSPEMDEMRRFAWSLAGAGLGVWLLGLLGGWWLAGRAIRPIESISRTASRIAEGNLRERIDTAGGVSELDQLSGVLNRTFDRLHAAFEQQRQFTADAAHELRTPVAILTAETQRILKRERSLEEYKAAIETCGQTTARMRRLVEDLLLLARQEGAATSRQPCDLADILRETMEHLTPLAAAKGIQIQADLRPSPCLGQPLALSTVVNNLVANAIQHHPSHGHVWISTVLQDGTAVLTVRDDGSGISAEDLPHIFDRFYRADKARTADASLHTGLGLAIVKTIVSVHGGTVDCQSSPGAGALFTVRMPVR